MPEYFNIHTDNLETTAFNNRKLKGNSINRNPSHLHTVPVHSHYFRHAGDLYLSRCLHRFHHHGIQAARKSLKIELIAFSPYFFLSSFQEERLIPLWLYFIYSFVCEKRLSEAHSFNFTSKTNKKKNCLGSCRSRGAGGRLSVCPARPWLLCLALPATGQTDKRHCAIKSSPAQSSH